MANLTNCLSGNNLTEKENIEKLLLFRGLDASLSNQFNCIEDLIPYFEKDSVSNYEVTHPLPNSSRHKWAKSFASNRIKGDAIPPMELEPFVARYVIAINQIGIKTYFSCDGWHKKSFHKLIIGFADRNSKVWHKLIFEKIQENKLFPLNWEYSGNFCLLKLPIEDKNCIEIYKILNSLAEHIEHRQEELLNLKCKVIKELKNTKKNSLSEDELFDLLKNITG